MSWGAPSNPNLPSSLLPQCCWAASSAPCCSPSSSWPSASTSRSGGGNRAGPGGSVVEKCCWSRLVLPPGTQPSHHLPRPRPGTPRCCRHGSSSTQHCVAPSGMVLHPRDIGGSIVTSLSMTVWPGAGNHTPVLRKLDPWTSRECFRSKPGWVWAGSVATHLPPKTQCFSEADPTRCTQEHPGGGCVPGAWGGCGELDQPWCPFQSVPGEPNLQVGTRTKPGYRHRRLTSRPTHLITPYLVLLSD